MSVCGSCKHYTRATNMVGLGNCGRWRQGYDWQPQQIARNEVVVEGDEGWGAFMGPDFGCVLWESAPERKPQGG